MGALIAIDAGTSALKVGVFEVGGAVLALERRDHGLDRSAAGRCEQRVEETTASIRDCIRSLAGKVSLGAVAAISVSSQRGTVVALGADGAPRTEYITWMDRRGVPWLDVVEERVGAENYYATAGHPIVPATGISKVLSIRHDDAVWDGTAVVGAQQTHLLSWLGTDGLVCDRSTGSFHFPMDADSAGWSQEIAATLDLPTERLPRLVDSTDVVGALRSDLARELGLPAGIPIVAGGGDGQCAGVGSRTIASGDALLNIGTAAGVLVPLDRPLRDPRRILNCAAYVMPGTWEMEGHTQASGIALDWFRGQLDRASLLSYDAIGALAAEAPAGAAGVLFVPTFNGATAPVVEGGLGAAFVGLRLEHDRRHLARAVLEGICLEIATLLEAVEAVAGRATRIHVAGGATRSATWMQILADVLARPVQVVDPVEAALVGAAACAAVGSGAYPDISTAVNAFSRGGTTYDPDPSAVALHDDLRGAYAHTFDALVSIANAAKHGRHDA